MSYRADINTIYSDLLALFRANLATLNQNLTGTITNGTLQIVDGVPKAVGDSLHPIIFIHQGSKTETSEAIGNRCRKKVVQTILITATSKMFIKEGNTDNKDVRNLMANIDELIRNNPTFSTQVLDCNPSNTQLLYDDRFVYINTFETSLDCELDIRGI